MKNRCFTLKGKEELFIKIIKYQYEKKGITKIDINKIKGELVAHIQVKEIEKKSFMDIFFKEYVQKDTTKVNFLIKNYKKKFTASKDDQIIKKNETNLW